MLKRAVAFACAWSVSAASLHAQIPPPAGPTQEKPAHDHQPAETPTWRFMQDGVVYGVFNRQGGPRGGEEFFVPNWWMGMLHARAGPTSVRVERDAQPGSGDGREERLSRDLPGRRGARRQAARRSAASARSVHAAGRRHGARRSTRTTSLMLAGGPVGEPTLGPVAFMHRPSAAGLVLAPLGHHTFDSTHLSFGVVTAAVERGRWTFEGRSSTAASRTTIAGTSNRARSIRWRPCVVPADDRAGSAGLDRPPARARRARSGRRRPNDGVDRLVSAATQPDSRRPRSAMGSTRHMANGGTGCSASSPSSTTPTRCSAAWIFSRSRRASCSRRGSARRSRSGRCARAPSRP